VKRGLVALLISLVLLVACGAPASTPTQTPSHTPTTTPATTPTPISPTPTNTGPNHPPVIDRVMAEWVQIERGATGLIKCIAHDPDGDELTYQWEPARGAISGEGATINYTAPWNYVDVTVNVVVSDGRGGTKESGVIFSVVCCGAEVRNPEWID